MGRFLSLLGLALAASALAASPALADSCAAGNLSGIVGTTCSIGSLQFTFDSLSSDNSNGVAWTASDFYFTPVANGFTLSFDGGPQYITAPANGDTGQSVNLYYRVTALDGLLAGVSATGGTLSSGGSAGSSWAMYWNGVCNPDLSICNSMAFGYNESYTSEGSTNFYSFQNQLSGSPFSSGYGWAVPFSLYADTGNSAYWDGTGTTFTFSTVPEPGTLMLLGTGLVGLAGFLRRKLGP